MSSTKFSFFAFLSACLLIVLAAPSAAAQAATDDPVYKAYRGVTLEMKKDDVREKLGNREDEFDGEDYFEFSDDENARVMYDEDGAVRAIVVTYTGKLSADHKPKAVIGEEIAARDDGGMYKMVHYPDHGFWVSFVKTGGDSPMVIITIQKMD